MKRFISVDAHCDTVLKAYMSKVSFAKSRGKTHIDLAGLDKLAPHIQFMALFSDRFITEEHFHSVMELADWFYKGIYKAEKGPFVIKDRASLSRCLDSKSLGIILAVEGAYLLSDNLHRIDILYKLGVRCISLTWNPGNKLCGGIGDCKARGLGGQGKQAVERMNELGVLIDLSHISQRGFWDIIELTKAPVIASHSNCLSLCDSKRNLDDRQLEALGRVKGVAGVNFVPDFLGENKANIRGVADHIEHIVQTAGIDSVGLGSDFDGTDELPEGITGVESYTYIYEELLKRNYSEEDARKVMGGNMLRVVKTVVCKEDIDA